MKINKQVISMTPRAVSQLNHILSQHTYAPSGRAPPLDAYEYIRLGLTSKGCGGLSYKLDYSNTKERFDELIEHNNIKLLIAPNVLLHVIGTELDFVSNRLKSEFVFNNPNSKGNCGCGMSFTI